METAAGLEQKETRNKLLHCVGVCVQLNRDWTWKEKKKKKKPTAKTGLLFFFPGESQEIRCTFQTTQSRTDERGRKQEAAQTGVNFQAKQDRIMN